MGYKPPGCVCDRYRQCGLAQMVGWCELGRLGIVGRLCLLCSHCGLWRPRSPASLCPWCGWHSLPQVARLHWLGRLGVARWVHILCEQPDLLGVAFSPGSLCSWYGERCLAQVVGIEAATGL